MSKQTNSPHFPDATGKATNEDKYGLYESSKTDSGFMSGEISEEITDSGILGENKTKKSSSDKRDEKKGAEAHMLIDSGVCLVEDFSKISLNKGLNDLNTASKVPQPPVAKIKPTDPDEIPWKLYYEQNEDGDTHLHLAIAEGYVEVALALIRAAPYPRLLDTPNDDDQTPLHLAVETSQWKIARWLVVSGAQPCPRDIRGDSPLHIAARTNDCMSVQAIADPVKQQERDELALSYQGYPYRQCDFDQWNYLGQTCVHVAALHGNVQVLRHLVWYGANVNARDGCSGYAALHYAVQRRDEPLVHFLLQYQGVDMTTLTYGGKTALEVNPGVSPTMRAALRNRGVPTPYTSEDEDEDDSEDEMMYENTRLFSVPMVNASA